MWKALIKRKWLRVISNLLLNYNIFINENLTLKNNKIAFVCCKLKCRGHIEKTCTKDGIVHILTPEIQKRKVLRVYHLKDLFSLFPDYDFEEITIEDEQNDSMQSSC